MQTEYVSAAHGELKGLIERALASEIENTIDVMKKFVDAAHERKALEEINGVPNDRSYNSPLKKLTSVKEQIV